MAADKYVRFDWAVKRMLRDKANFDVLEGLITVLLNEEVHIEELLESEGNQQRADDKFNRVDIKAKNSKGEIIIVEVQLIRKIYYHMRSLYGVAKSITEHIQLGDKYDKVKKVYSISILYFDLGKGNDYVYHGQTTFKGINTGDTLQITTKERDVIEMKTPEMIFPEYYILRLNEFDKAGDKAVTPLEEWLDYLRSGNIKEDTKTPGLQQARQKLQYMQMSDADRHAYDNHIDNIMFENSALLAEWRDGRADGLAQGRAEGLAQGLEQGRAEGLEQGLAQGLEQGLEQGRDEGRAEGAMQAQKTMVEKMYSNGLSVSVISNCTGMTEEEVTQIIKSL